MKPRSDTGKIRVIKLPLSAATVSGLRSGDIVLISGKIISARDASLKRMIDALKRGEELPIRLKGQTLYYMGPTPARPGRVIGSAGPTTSSRMDVYTEALFDRGLKCTIGKGKRSPQLKEKMLRCKSVYFAVVGGTGALVSRCISSAEIIAYPDLGAEAIFALEVRNLPVVVINDVYGNDLYEQGRTAYQKS
jgi:fumarate hydratase subunit beta